jgi:uncharacterized protein (DUF362 family)
MVDILGVQPELVPTVATSIKMGLCSTLEAIDFPLEQPKNLAIADWKLPEALMPIDFALPRIMKSTFKHLYIRFIKEPIAAYSGK